LNIVISTLCHAKKRVLVHVCHQLKYTTHQLIYTKKQLFAYQKVCNAHGDTAFTIKF